MKINENKKGISLIVLIITIVVMLVIAAAIILNIDDTKIIGRAEKAAADNNLSVAKELRVVAKAEWRTNEDKLKKEHGSYRQYLISKLDEAGVQDVYVTANADLFVTKYVDKNGDEVRVPDGYIVSDLATENVVGNGLVIYEGTTPVSEDPDAQTTRNQFVWVPVDDIDLFERISASEDRYLEPNPNVEQEKNEHDEMYNSVKKYGGFYIARYEAGFPEGKNSTTVTTTDKPVSKKGADPWNNIPWGQSMTVATGGAAAYARQMVTNSELAVSTLCYGVQWDEALRFISTRGVKDTEYTEVGVGATKGNYSYSITKTGANPAYSFNNIYDMAGNLGEWTMECGKYNGYPALRHYRGRHFNIDTLEYNTAAHRVNINPEEKGNIIGFRVALYLK